MEITDLICMQINNNVAIPWGLAESTGGENQRGRSELRSHVVPPPPGLLREGGGGTRGESVGGRGRSKKEKKVIQQKVIQQQTYSEINYALKQTISYANYALKQTISYAEEPRYIPGKRLYTNRE